MVKILDSFSVVDNIKIKMSGKLSFLYDSMLSLMTDFFKQNFDSILG